MNKPPARTVKNTKFTDPEWYVSLTADILDLKFATLAKDLGKALNPEVIDTAKELVAIYQLAFSHTLQSQNIDIKASVEKNSEQLFFDYIVDPNFPSYHPLFQQLITNIELNYITQQNQQFSQPWSEVRRTLQREFAINFSSIIQSAASEHANAANYIGQLKSYVAPTESKVIAHMNGVLTDLEHEALAIDPDLTLRKSYTTPTCRIQLDKIREKSEESIENDNIIQALISRINSTNIPIVIHGQPGHGKTSTVKMLVNALSQWYRADAKPISIVFYEFKNLRALGDPIHKVLNSETPFIDNEGFFSGKHTVLILDGLDERQLADGSDEALKGFVSGLFRLADRMNNDESGTKLNLILTGRSQFVGQIKQSFNTDHWIFEIKDFSEDKINLWLQRFNAQKSASNSNNEAITIEQLHGYHLQDLIPQPILLSISSIMLSDSDGKKLLGELEQSSINRTQIYHTIIRWSYEKRWQKTPTASLNDQLEFGEYLVLLQAIAFEMFKSGNESIKLSVLAPALKSSIFDLDFLDNKSVGDIEQLCSQLRISFFFKGVEDKAFAFLHKSIKDFLIVSGMVDAFLLLLDSCNSKKLDKEADELYTIFGQASLSSEDHIPMLEEWIHHKADQFKPNHTKLMAIWERLGKQDFPVSFDTPGQAVETQRNVLLNYYQVISRYFPLLSADENKVLFGHEKVVLFNSSDDSRWQLMDSKVFCDTVFMEEQVKLSFKNQYIGRGVDNCSFPNQMYRVDFSNYILNNVIINNGAFDVCNFKFAQLLDCSIFNSVFNNCNFTDSTINCISDNCSDDSFPTDLTYFNRFLNCNFTDATLSGHFQNQCFGKKQFLFWNCNFDSTDFDCKKTSTVAYSEDFKGVKLPES